MGIKDKVKRASKIFTSDSKENLTEVTAEPTTQEDAVSPEEVPVATEGEEAVGATETEPVADAAEPTEATETEGVTEIEEPVKDAEPEPAAEEDKKEVAKEELKPTKKPDFFKRLLLKFKNVTAK